MGLFVCFEVPVFCHLSSVFFQPPATLGKFLELAPFEDFGYQASVGLPQVTCPRP